MKKWLALCVLGLTGCGAELERSSEVETLRVLGVHKDKSYATAEEQVTFSMLWHDPDGRDITPVWFAITEAEVDLVSRVLEADCDPTAEPADPDCECLSDPDGCQGGGGAGERPWEPTDALLPLCANPPRDSYSTCLELHRVLADPTLRAMASNPGESITLNVPASTVRPPTELLPKDFGLPSLKECPADETLGGFECADIYHDPPDPDMPPFGSMFVFFALCPGELGFANVSEGFGLVCNDENGEAFGPDDFQFGYSQVFLYEKIKNQNPVVEGIELDGVEVPAACIGPACLEEDSELPEGCDGDIPCFKVCTESDEDDCPEIDVKPIIPERVPCSERADGSGADCDNAEPDEVAKIAYGRDYEEQMWIRYYTDQGRMGSEVKLLNDATAGWNSDYGTELRLPQEPGPLRVWAVVYDNRGGQDWVRVDAYVEE